jgi:large subunit GTPase 1
MRSSQGNPDEARAARYILKDYVNAKLLFCHPPPGIEENLFNETTRRLALIRAAGKKKAPATRVGKDSDTFVMPTVATHALPSGGQRMKPNAIDDDFFGHDSLAVRPMIQGRNRVIQGFSRPRFYPHQNIVADDGTPIDSGSARIASVLANANAGSGKKHHKKMKRAKQRSGKGYD